MVDVLSKTDYISSLFISVAPISYDTKSVFRWEIGLFFRTTLGCEGELLSSKTISWSFQVSWVELPSLTVLEKEEESAWLGAKSSTLTLTKSSAAEI